MKELESLKSQKVALTSEVDDLENRSQRLEKLYEEQENLLNEIFGGEYGTEAENMLENQPDQVRALSDFMETDF